MKFRKPEKFEPWSKEKTEAQILHTELEIRELSREENDTNATLSYWRNEKRILQLKISNKQTYINQLKEQLKESEV